MVESNPALGYSNETKILNKIEGKFSPAWQPGMGNLILSSVYEWKRGNGTLSGWKGYFHGTRNYLWYGPEPGRCDNFYITYEDDSGNTTTLHFNASSHGTVGIYYNNEQLIPFGSTSKDITQEMISVGQNFFYMILGEAGIEKNFKNVQSFFLASEITAYFLIFWFPNLSGSPYYRGNTLHVYDWITKNCLMKDDWPFWGVIHFKDTLKSLSELELAMEKVKSHFGDTIEDIFVDTEKFTVYIRFPEAHQSKASNTWWKIEREIIEEIRSLNIL